MGEASAKFIQNGAVELYNDNTIRLKTTGTGVSVNGTFLASGKGEFEDDVSVSGALIVGGATQLNSTVTIAGSTIFKDSI